MNHHIQAGFWSASNFRSGLGVIIVGLCAAPFAAMANASDTTTNRWPTLKQVRQKWDDVQLQKVQSSAESGDPTAQHYLGYCYAEGLRGLKDPTVGRTWYERAWSSGYAPSANNLGVLYWAGNGVPKDMAKAVAYIREAAQLDHPGAMVSLGRMSRFGEGVSRNIPDAIRWFSRASALGNSSGTLNLGWVYGYESDAPMDPGKAVRLYLRAAEQGEGCAMFELYLCYRRGRGVPADQTESLNWARRGAEAGCSDAQDAMGYSYEHPPDHGPADMAEAARWYQMSANQNNASGLFHLGKCYITGAGVQMDQERGLELTRKAADLGRGAALAYLGELYARGIGEPRSEADTSQKLFEQAAKQGAPRYEALVRRKSFGIGTQKDLIEAAKWYCAGAMAGEIDFTLADKLDLTKPKPSLGTMLHSAPEGSAISSVMIPLESTGFNQVLSLYLKSAAASESEAPLEIARMYALGIDVPKSASQAWLWYNLASARGANKAATLCREVESKMDPEDLVKQKGVYISLLSELQRLRTAILNEN